MVMVFEACGKIVDGNLSAVAGCPFAEGFAGGVFGFFVALGAFILSLALVVVYVYHSLAWYAIAKKLKHKNPWLAWIPFAGSAMRLQLGRFHWAWIFLLFIPIFGWIALGVLLIVSYWRVFEKRKYPGWFSLGMLIPQVGGILYLVTIGFVAWKDRKKRLSV